jgi:hypothetical protein
MSCKKSWHLKWQWNNIWNNVTRSREWVWCCPKEYNERHDGLACIWNESLKWESNKEWGSCVTTCLLLLMSDELMRSIGSFWRWHLRLKSLSKTGPKHSCAKNSWGSCIQYVSFDYPWLVEWVGIVIICGKIEE